MQTELGFSDFMRFAEVSSWSLNQAEQTYDFLRRNREHLGLSWMPGGLDGTASPRSVIFLAQSLIDLLDDELRVAKFRGIPGVRQSHYSFLCALLRSTGSICLHCGGQMRPAGDFSVCTGCGTTIRR